MFALDVVVEGTFLSRRIVTERTFMGSLSRVREEVSLNMTLPLAPKPTVLPRTPVLLLVGVHGLVLCEVAFRREPCLTTIHIARIGLQPRVPIVVLFEMTTVRKPFSTPRKGTGKGPLSRVGPDMYLELTPCLKALSTPLELTRKGLLSKVHRLDMSYDITLVVAPIITLHIGTGPPLPRRYPLYSTLGLVRCTLHFRRHPRPTAISFSFTFLSALS